MKSENILGKRFIQRFDVRAEQQADGGYLCIRRPLKQSHLNDHIKGARTIGAYVLNEKGHARYTVLDADDDVQWHKLFNAKDQLRQENIPSYMEGSRRGGHLWFFFEWPISGHAAKRFGEGLKVRFGLESEIYPKSVTGDVGSLIRLPFGIHRKSGKRYPFIDEDAKPIAPTVQKQIRMLGQAEEVALGDIWFHMRLAPLEVRQNQSEQKDSRDVLEYVSQFVELKPTKAGGIGHCPFHEDEHMSFSVNRDGNYWNCFAGCGGGSVTHFKRKWIYKREN